MSDSAILKATARTKVGSRDARRLRGEGRIPGSLQSNDGKANVDLHFDAGEFHTLRRAHVHLFDLDIDGSVEAAVIREMQWDSLGDGVIHVEFKRVTRGVETESEVGLVFLGQPKEGVFNHLVDHIAIRSIPSLIPDEIEISVGNLELGTHLRAGDIKLPEGVSLASDPDLEVAVVSAPRAEATDEDEGEEEGEETAG